MSSSSSPSSSSLLSTSTVHLFVAPVKWHLQEHERPDALGVRQSVCFPPDRHQPNLLVTRHPLFVSVIAVLPRVDHGFLCCTPLRVVVERLGGGREKFRNRCLDLLVEFREHRTLRESGRCSTAQRFLTLTTVPLDIHRSSLDASGVGVDQQLCERILSTHRKNSSSCG